LEYVDNLNVARRERKDVTDDGRYSAVGSCEGAWAFDGNGAVNVKGKAFRVCDAARANMALRRGAVLETISFGLGDVNLFQGAMEHERTRQGSQ
jgi:hypothetical protein